MKKFHVLLLEAVLYLIIALLCFFNAICLSLASWKHLDNYRELNRPHHGYADGGGIGGAGTGVGVGFSYPKKP